jgi:hypothetical protein
MKRLALLGALLAMPACTQEPAPAKIKETSTPAVDSGAENEVKAEARNIEEAANAAAKLVEEEAKAEIDGYATGGNNE